MNGDFLCFSVLSAALGFQVCCSSRRSDDVVFLIHHANSEEVSSNESIHFRMLRIYGFRRTARDGVS